MVEVEWKLAKQSKKSVFSIKLLATLKPLRNEITKVQKKKKFLIDLYCKLRKPDLIV